MAIDSQGWFDWAVRVPGPADKKYSAPNQVGGVVPHSMVGYYAAWYNRLMSTEREANGRYTPYAAASVTGSVLFDGSLIQHYPLTVSCWGNGSRFPNTHFNPFEVEGGAPGNESQPFNPAQLNTLVRIIKESSEWRNWRPRRPTNASDVGATLYEHNECRRWGSPATACPSNRVPWTDALRRLQEGGMATPGEIWVATFLLDLAKKALASQPANDHEKGILRALGKEG